jgi:hypothetical protein
MLPLLGKNWFLWWMVAIMVVLRWHHVIAMGRRKDVAEHQRTRKKCGLRRMRGWATTFSEKRSIVAESEVRSV